MGMIIQNGKQYFPVYDDTEIKALPTVDTASGAIASFNTDLTENLVEVKCQIVAKQASGTPSPNNPLPITTYSEANVVVSPYYITNFVQGGIADGTGEDVLSTIRLRSDYIGFNDNVIDLFINKSQTNEIIRSVHFYGETYNYLGVASITASTAHITSIPTGTKYVRIVLMFTTNADITYQGETVIVNGTIYTVNFGQTVANGVIDITTGKLRVTHGVVTDLSTLNWNYNSTYTRFIANVDYKGSGSNNVASFLLCETYENVALNSLSDKTISLAGNGNQLQIMDLNYTDNTSFKNSIQNVKLVYELATPIEIQLDSITLQALLNENNIWCDTGDTEVKFLLTVGKKIT